MDEFAETYNTWNKVAALYQEKFMNLGLYNESYDFFCSLLPDKGSGILDMGCGPGIITKYLLDKRPEFKILGIDYAPAMIELARRIIPDAEFKVMDVRQIIGLPGKFDGIISGFCIPYMSYTEVSALIKDAVKLLNEKGIIYLSFVEGNPADSGYQTGSSGDRVYFYFHDTAVLVNCLAECGFNVLREYKTEYKRNDNITDTHVILIASKGTGESPLYPAM